MGVEFPDSHEPNFGIAPDRRRRPEAEITKLEHSLSHTLILSRIPPANEGGNVRVLSLAVFFSLLAGSKLSHWRRKQGKRVTQA